MQVWSGGINTLVSNANGTYRLAVEGFKPRANYQINVTSTRWLTGDVVGDGTSDLVQVWSGGINTLVSNANGTYRLAVEGFKPRANYQMNVTSTRWLTGDVVGDGTSDLVQVWSGGINTLVSNANGTFRLAVKGFKPRANYQMNVTSTRWLTGDVVGDGTSDLVQVWSGGINTLVSNANGTYRLAARASSRAPTTPWTSRPRAG